MELAYIFLGWLLGMLSPAIVNRIIRKYSKHDLHNGIMNELTNLQQLMVCSAYTMCTKYGTYNKDFVYWCISIFDQNPNFMTEVSDSLKRQVKMEDDVFDQCAKKMKNNKDVGSSLKQYSLSFTELHLADLSLFSYKFQSLLFQLRSKISIYNNESEKADNYLIMTFDSSLSDVNHKIVKEALTGKYRILQDTAMQIADKISEIRKLGII